MVNADVLSAMPDLGDETVDVFTCFDSMEHWHNSPRALLHTLLRMLKPRGMLLLATPNCVNLRNRITVPFWPREMVVYVELVQRRSLPFPRA